jgi:hypothetical protein
MMSISEREQETLESIADGLARSAPKLAAMLTMFSRLTADEKMPVRAPVRRAARGLGTGAATAAGRAGLLRRRQAGRKPWGWMWLVAAAALLAAGLIMSGGTGSGRCTASPATACRQAPAPAHPGLGRGGS